MDRRTFMAGVSTLGVAAGALPSTLSAAPRKELTVTELSSGLAPETDLVIPKKPDDPEMREGASVWLYDDAGQFGLPRAGLDAVGASWDRRDFHASFCFPDGRVLNAKGTGGAVPPIGPDGRPTIFGTAGLSFITVEPYKRARMVYEGPAYDETSAQQAWRKPRSGATAQVKFEADLTMVVPAWIQDVPQDSEDADAVGVGMRMEQLFRADCRLELEGKTRAFTASGLRIHRQSIRKLGGFFGHVWQSAVFPDGRAFGMVIYPPKPDGTPRFNDAFIWKDGRFLEAKVTKCAWIEKLVPTGEDVSLELESELGRTRISATSGFSTYNPDMTGFTLQQAGAHYTWDDQKAWGMLERSMPRDLTKG